MLKYVQYWRLYGKQIHSASGVSAPRPLVFFEGFGSLTSHQGLFPCWTPLKAWPSDTLIRPPIFKVFDPPLQPCNCCCYHLLAMLRYLTSFIHTLKFRGNLRISDAFAGLAVAVSFSTKPGDDEGILMHDISSDGQ